MAGKWKLGMVVVGWFLLMGWFTPGSVVEGAGAAHRSSSTSVCGFGSGRGGRLPLQQQLKRGQEAVCAACSLTTYKVLCEQYLLGYPGSKAANPPQLVVLGLRVALDAVTQAYSVARALERRPGSGGAVQDCAELMGDSRDQLANTIATLSRLPATGVAARYRIEDALVWTSAALTYQTTCSDGLTSQKRPAPAAAAAATLGNHVVRRSSPLVTNALDLIAHLGKHLCTWQDLPTAQIYPSC